MNRYLLSKISFNYISKIFGFNFYKFLDFITESQYWSDEQIADYQIRQLHRLIIHAYENVPFYKELMKRKRIQPSDIKEISDLEKLPIIRKADLIENFEKTTACNKNQYKYLKRSTSGTTGSPFSYYNDGKSWGLNWATKIRTFRWGNYEIGKDSIGIFAGGSLNLNGKLNFKTALWRYLNNFISFPVMHINEKELKKCTDLLEAKEVQFLRGYPTTLYTLAKYLKNNNRILPMRSVFCTAEMLFNYQRELIEQVFDCKVFNTYGCGDGMGGANECEQHKGLHFNFETAIMNVVDKFGNEVESGKEGELVLTSLYDYTMPLIRYAPGDLVIKSERKCICGRNLPLLESISGRTSDLILLPNGRVLNGLSIPFEKWEDRISQFQIIQTEVDLIEVNIVPKDNFRNDDNNKVRQIMQFHAGEDIRIEVNYMRCIPLSPSGKFRYVISKINN